MYPVRAVLLPLVRGPRALPRWAIATLVANIGIVVTGGLVRLTGSGLGCPTWPRCTDDSFVAYPELGIGHERIVGAARPGRAAQPGSGQPDQATGDHDADVGHQGGDRPARQRPRAAYEGQQHRAHRVHQSQRKNLRVRAAAISSQTSNTSNSAAAGVPVAADRRPSPSAAVGSRASDGCRTVG